MQEDIGLDAYYWEAPPQYLGTKHIFLKSEKKYYFYTNNPIDLIYLREYLFSQDSKKMFQSLVSLVIHHSVMPECLPCPLILSHSDIGSDDENHVNKQLSTSCQWVSFKIEIEIYIFYYNHPANLRNFLN